MHRFFIGEDQILDGRATITGDDVKHITGPLRMEVGQELELVAQGQIYLSKISRLDKKQVEVEIIRQYAGTHEPRTKITLYQGLAKGSKMDYIIQKGTELGISEFVIVETERSVAKIANDKKKDAKLERWQKVADEAAKQSKRDILPRVRDLVTFKQMLEEIADRDNILIPYEKNSGDSIKTLLKSMDQEGSQSLGIIIGPEGGFEAWEVEEVVKLGGHSLSLGPRILRTETAGLVAASMVIYELEDI